MTQLTPELKKEIAALVAQQVKDTDDKVNNLIERISDGLLFTMKREEVIEDFIANAPTDIGQQLYEKMMACALNSTAALGITASLLEQTRRATAMGMDYNAREALNRALSELLLDMLNTPYGLTVISDLARRLRVVSTLSA